jgi:hypothetical protein
MSQDPNGKSNLAAVAGADPVDDQIRAVMSALDSTVSESYFDQASTQVVARLDEAKQLPTLPDLEKSMSNEMNSSVPSPIGTDSAVPMRAIVPAGAVMASRKINEDSGLHDLKSLAASTKERITSRRTTTSPPIDEDALLSSASASFKALALPEPARVVSLPNPGTLPALARSPKATHSDIAAISDSKATSYQPPTSNKKLFIVGGGMAAAAAAVALFAINSGGKSNDAATPAITTGAGAPVAVAAAPGKSRAEIVPATATAGAAAIETAPLVVAPAGNAAVVATTLPVEDSPKGGKAKAPVAVDKMTKEKNDKAETAEPKANAKGKDGKDGKAAEVAPTKPVKTEGDAGSVDDLLKEAGVAVAAKDAKPTLDKKELTRDDIASVMKGRSGAAQACLAKTGVAGTVGVKLSVAPSGKVQKATATGPLAGTPTGDCVVAAASNATFPAWDGRPTTVIYSYLLSE